MPLPPQPDPTLGLDESRFTELPDEPAATNTNVPDEDSDNEDAQVKATPLENMKLSKEEYGKVVEGLRGFGVDLDAKCVGIDGKPAPGMGVNMMALNLSSSRSKRPMSDGELPDTKRQRYQMME